MTTTHSLIEDDSRDLGFVPDETAHLIVTHPPAFGACGPDPATGQLSAIADYEEYLAQLDGVLRECGRVLVPGGLMACVVSPIAVTSEDLPLAADIQVRARALGFDGTRSIRWLEPGSFEIDESAFLGGTNQPSAESPWRAQEVLVLRRPGPERVIDPEIAAASRMPARFYAECSSPVWVIDGDEDAAHPQGFPFELAARLVRMLSYQGDTVLDPFAGSGTTNAAAQANGRNSIAVEIEPTHFARMTERMRVLDGEGGEVVIKKTAQQAGARAGLRRP